MNKTCKKIIKNTKGQTSVEYILMIVVVIFCATGVFKKLDEYIISSPNSFVNRYLSTFQETFGGANGGFQGGYRYFSIRK